MRLAPIALFVLAIPASAADDGLLTVAEKSDFKATARYAEVVNLCRALADKRPGMIRLDELGKTGEGRTIPLMIVADPPVSTPEEAARSGKLVVLIIGNIHAGEVCGKEALPILVRELTDAPGHPLLKDVILLAAPIYNADGNERVRKENRPGQVGPEDGMGQRTNAAGLDLNRDFVKLEASETRGLVRAFNRWDPHLFLDLHTTNGSHHRYLVTYQGPLNPGGDENVLKYVRDTMFPEVGRGFKAKSGQDAFFYGNFDRDHNKWEMYGAQPRFSTTYAGVRNRIGILSEAYSYAPYRDRIFGTRDFVVACLQFASAHKAEIVEKLREARRSTVEAGRDPKEGDRVAIRSEVRAFPKKVEVLGFVEKPEGNRTVSTGEPKAYTVDLEADFAPTLTVNRPFAYLVPAKYASVVENLQRHGLEISTLREDISLDVEAAKVESVRRSPRPFQGHHEVTVETSTKPDSRVVPAGTVVVRTAQALGSLAVLLLEPRSEDGLTTWNFFDADLAPGSEFPVLRLPRPAPVWTSPARPLPEDRATARASTAPAGRAPGGRRGGFGGGSNGPPRWIAGEKLLQNRDGQLLAIDPETGRGRPFLDRPAMVAALAKLEGVVAGAAEIAQGLPEILGPTGAGGLYEVGGTLIYASFDGKSASIVSKGGERGDSLHTFSPHGKQVAFVRNNDLYTIAVDTGAVRRLTEGGTDKKRNGKADWVYYEELFNRNSKAFWWSPDSSKIAYLQLDDAPVRAHPVLNDLGARREVEETPYPRAGEPNPIVRLGVVPSSGGETTWADLSAYPADSTILSHVGWWPDGSALAYAQDRTQTYLDVLKISADGKAARVLRDTTKAWVESPGDPHFLDDGSFLLTSERDGDKHIYHFAADGSLKRQITSGEWEVSAVHHVDPSPTGWVHFSANRDMPLGLNLYRARIEGGPVERLTLENGDHRSVLSPGGRYVLDTWSDIATPPRTNLLDAEGHHLRTIDAGQGAPIESAGTPPRRRFQIKARDGFLLEAELITPPEIDPSKVYPAWFMTYGGPHMATVSDGYANGRTAERALAADGFVVFRMDPRSASTKGVAPTWSAYKHLGVQEVKDVEDAINWLKKEPYVDGTRIGMSGHSYGGYLTAYCMTHTGLFAAGIAGAPVTDWRDYDSIYTERYMLTPEQNPEGYDASSVVRAAGKLHGRLLILHGLMDDNVSIRNTVRLVDALQKADKDFEMMIYPPSRHGIGGAHYQRLQNEFIHRLGGPRDRPAAR